jgi:hypothetical protein
MFVIRQNATHKVVLGPAVAVGDGFTPVTTLDVSTADEAEAILHDNGTVVDISGYTWAAIATADGYYHLTLQAAISGTVGHLTIVVNDDNLCLPLRADFTVLEEAVYDAMYAASATGPLQATTGGRKLTVEADGVAHADVKEWLGVAPLALASQQVQVDLTAIHGTALTETASGRLAAAFVKLFDVVTPLLVASDVMRGTDNAALASVLGALADAAAAGDPTSADTLMQYVKQLVNVLVGTDGVAAWPAAVAPGNGVSLAEALRATYNFSVSSAAWGSINSGIVFRGTVTAADPGVSFTVGGLAGQGAGAFIDANTPWYAYCFRDAGGAAAAPQGEQQQITGYTSATGLFTTNAFTVPIAVGDDMVMLSGRIASVPDILTDTGTTLPTTLATIITHLTDIKGNDFSSLNDSLRPIRLRGDTAWITADVSALATAAKLLSYFQSALRSDVTVDADIGGTYDDATDSQQAIRDNQAASGTVNLSTEGTDITSEE